MSPEERQLLTALFDRVRTASATPRDRDAEGLIEQQLKEQPYATYYLAQAVIVQEKGLEAASGRIKDLEDRIRQLEDEAARPAPAQQSGGFLSSIFGSSQAPAGRPAQAPGQAPASGPWGGGAQPGYQQNAGYPQGQGSQRGYDDGYRGAPPPQQGGFSGPWGGAQQAAPSAGGSFLRGALGTAAGVAGGMLLANTLSSAFSHHTSALGLGSPFSEASNPFGTPQAPVEETVVNNYYGDDAIRDASNTNGAGDADNTNGAGSDIFAGNTDAGGNDAGNDGGWQQADFGGGDDSASDFGGFDNDDSMNA